MNNTNWKSSTIKDHLLDFKGGASLKKTEFTASGVQVIPKKAVQVDGKFSISDPIFTSQITANNNKNSIVGNKYLITPLRDLVPSAPCLGRIAANDLKGEMLLAQGVYGLKVADTIDRKYLCLISNTYEFREQVRRLKVGSTQVHIRGNDFLSIQFPLPPLETQKRIVSLLDQAQALIDKRKEQLALMDQLIQSLFYDMFGDPATNPKGWDELTIGDSCYFVKDGPHKSLDYVDTGIPFVSVKDIINGYLNFSEVRYISPEVYEENKGRCKPEFGDILYTKGGTTGFAMLVDIKIDFLNWVHIAVLKFEKEKLNGKFFETMLNSKYCYEQSQRYTRGIANRDLVLGQMKKIMHYCPPVELQNSFAERVQKIEAQKKVMDSSLKELEDNFNSLMQRAFKGELV